MKPLCNVRDMSRAYILTGNLLCKVDATLVFNLLKGGETGTSDYTNVGHSTESIDGRV
jgi:hypothetical protein